MIDGRAFTIIGVSAATFDGIAPGFSPQIRIPLTMNDVFSEQFPQLAMNQRRRRYIRVFRKNEHGVTIDQAKAGLQPLFHQTMEMEVKMPAFAKASNYSKTEFLRMWIDTLPASKGRSELREQFSKPLLALMAIVALVLDYRLLQSGQPFNCACVFAAEGNCVAAGARGGARTAGASIAGGERFAFLCRRCCGAGTGHSDRPHANLVSSG